MSVKKRWKRIDDAENCALIDPIAVPPLPRRNKAVNLQLYSMLTPTALYVALSAPAEKNATPRKAINN